jgi:hypothetical protein
MLGEGADARHNETRRGLTAPAPLPDLMRRLNRPVLFHLSSARSWS